MNILEQIVAKKAVRLKDSKRNVSISELKDIVRDTESARNFRAAVKKENSQLKLIAEIKKASPSKGIIRHDFDALKIASIYEEKPVSAVSILTEEDFFQGDLSYIRAVKKITKKPLLRKDFIFDEYQIYESRANSADAILLIAAILEINQAREYYHLASELGLHVLFEIHNEYELEKALASGVDIIGINNRDLKTLKIDISTSLSLKKLIPSDKIVVSESGIRDRSDIIRLEEASIDAMLIGTSIMQSPDIGTKIDELMKSA